MIVVGGREEIRTPDPLLAKQVLSQLSYTPTVGVTLILKHFPSTARYPGDKSRFVGNTEMIGKLKNWHVGNAAR